MVFAFYEAYESRVRKHFCVYKIPGDEVEGTQASILPKGTNLEKKHSQSKLQDGAKATWAAKEPLITSSTEKGCGRVSLFNHQCGSPALSGPTVSLGEYIS